MNNDDYEYFLLTQAVSALEMNIAHTPSDKK